MLPGLKKRVVNLHDVIMYVAIARKHLRLMALLLSFCWLSAIVFYVYSRPVYLSRALVKTDLVDRIKSAEIAFQEKNRVSGVATEIVLPHILERTAARLGVKADARDIQAFYVKKVVARTNSEGHIEIESYPYSYDWAKRWPETLVREYLDYRQHRRKAEMEQRTQNHYAERKQLLDLIEEDRKKISEANIATSLSKALIDYQVLAYTPRDIGEARRRIDKIERARVQLTSPDLDTIARLSLISAVTDELNVGTSIEPLPNAQAPSPSIEVKPNITINQQPTQPEDSTPAVEIATPPAPSSFAIVTPQIATETAWRDVVRQINILQAQKSELLNNYQPGHRFIVSIQEQLDTLATRLEGELVTALEHLNANYKQLVQKLSDLEKKLPLLQQAEQELKKARDQQGIEGTGLSRWLTLIKQSDRNFDEDQFAYDRDRIKISYAGITQLNPNPVSPNRLSLLIYATALGLVLAVGLPFLIEYLDHTLTNLEDVETAFQLRGLGIIPRIAANEERPNFLGVPAVNENNLIENFRVVRTNLLSMGMLSKPPHVVIVTSAMPKEGKTFVSTNLAMSFAQTGAKTLIIDTDLRRGRLHRLFGYRKQPGLSGVLMEQVSIDEAIRPTPKKNLYILSAGQHLETGTELLGSKKFVDLLNTLKSKYDRIVMDTPPVLGLSETSVLQNYVDGIIFVIWSGQTPIKSVRAAIELLQANGANFYGFVLNRLDLSNTANYYQYYYYSHDYYYQYQPSAQIEDKAKLS
jgi:polysaccharide biosynthesis transport protein